MTDSIKAAILAKCEYKSGGIKDTWTNGYEHGRKEENDQLMPIIAELLDICVAQAKALDDIKTHQATLTNMPELTMAYLISDKALAATIERMKKLVEE